MNMHGRVASQSYSCCINDRSRLV